MDKLERARGAIAKVAGTDPASLERSQNLLVDLGIDSPKALALLVELEEALSIEISDEAAAGMESVGDVLDYVAALP